MTNPNNNNLWKYAGLGGQFIAGIALFLFGGIKLDEWLNTSSPMATWILPLVYITAIIIKIVIETGKKKQSPMPSTIKPFFPVVAVFALIAIFILTSVNFLQSKNIDATLLHGANFFFLIVGLFSVALQSKGLENKNAAVFVRMVMGGMMLKMFCSIIALVLYVYLSGSAFNKRGVFISLFMYLIYLAAEVFILMKKNKKKYA